ncbi:MAG: helix-hairpin-helix domain-containing protein [Gemmatimonadetes bacterium]|nr:helix-hairpin-helix domain-containing protein [Gemmatimonadota bacterium]
MTLSGDERRALAIIVGLLVIASGARWLERPQRVLEELPALDVAALEAASREGRDEARAAAEPLKGPIDPNTAPAADLVRLPGVGPSLAERIIEERERAQFRYLEDLTRVRGIGLTLATAMAGRVTLPTGPPRETVARNTGLTPVETASPVVSETTPAGSLDINYIGSSDLQKVRGIGPALAARLIARRDSLGRFASWEQIDEVAGIGPVVLARLKETLILRP